MEALTRTDVAQPALFAVSMALAEVAADCGLEPDLVTGHSLGEYTAAAVSRSARRRRRDAAGLHARPADGRDPGAEPGRDGGHRRRGGGAAGRAVRAGRRAASRSARRTSTRRGRSWCRASDGAVERLLALLEDEPGARGMRLPVGAAFHSSLMVPVREELRGPLGEASIGRPGGAARGEPLGPAGGRRRGRAHGARSSRSPSRCASPTACARSWTPAARTSSSWGPGRCSRGWCARWPGAR